MLRLLWCSHTHIAILYASNGAGDGGVSVALLDCLSLVSCHRL